MLGFRRPALKFAGLGVADLFALGHYLLGLRPGHDHNTRGIGGYEVAGRYSHPAGHHGYSKLRDDQTTAGRHRYRRQPVHGEAQLSMFIDIPERPVGHRARGTAVNRPDRSVTAPDRAILTTTGGQHDKRARRNVIKVVSRVGRVPVGGTKLDRERQAHGPLSRRSGRMPTKPPGGRPHRSTASEIWQVVRPEARAISPSIASSSRATESLREDMLASSPVAGYQEISDTIL